MSTTEYAPFDGDGRAKKNPPENLPIDGGQPRAITNASARRLIEQFNIVGMSHHSGAMTMLWVPIVWCQHHNQPFEVWRWRTGDLSSYCIFLGKIPAEVNREGASMVLSSVYGHLDVAVRWSNGSSSINTKITQEQYQRILAITQEDLP